MPWHLFIDNSYRSMSDDLAKMFFPPRILREALTEGVWTVLIWMLPGYLLHTSLLTPVARMKRAQRMHRLSLLIAIALLYMDKYEKLGREAYPGNAAFSRVMIFKYFIVAMRFLAELRENRDTYLGALGTHPLEHFFALVRFLMGGRGRADDFRRAARKAVLWRHALAELGIEVATKSKSSNSGVRVSESDRFVEFANFTFHMKMALQLFQFMDSHFVSEEGRWEAATAAHMDRVDVRGWLENMLESDSDGQVSSYRSLAKLCFAPTGQMAQTAALAAHRALEQGRINLEAGLGVDTERRVGQIWRLAMPGKETTMDVVVRRVDSEGIFVQLVWGPEHLPRSLVEELEVDELFAVGEVSLMDGWVFQERLPDVPICRQWVEGELVPITPNN
jgi:hypothetical protein